MFYDQHIFLNNEHQIYYGYVDDLPGEVKIIAVDPETEETVGEITLDINEECLRDIYVNSEYYQKNIKENLLEALKKFISDPDNNIDYEGELMLSEADSEYQFTDSNEIKYYADAESENFTAINGDDEIGSLEIAADPDWDRHWLNSIEVKADYQRKGIATNLMKLALRDVFVTIPDVYSDDYAYHLTLDGRAFVEALRATGILTDEHFTQEVPLADDQFDDEYDRGDGFGSNYKLYCP